MVKKKMTKEKAEAICRKAILKASRQAERCEEGADKKCEKLRERCDKREWSGIAKASKVCERAREKARKP